MNKPTPIKDLIDKRSAININGSSNNVNNVNVKNINNNVYVNTKDQLINQLIDECGGRASEIAQTIAEKLSDQRSINYFLKMARIHDSHLLFECLAETMLASREGRIKSIPAKYFVGVLKKKASLLNKKRKK